MLGDVGLAPYHDLDSKVPADVKTKMTQVTSDVVSGRTKTGWTSPPATVRKARKAAESLQ